MKFLSIPVNLALCIIILTAASASGRENPEINLSADLKKISDNSYSIQYKVQISGIDASAFMDQKINYPYNASIIEGMIMDRRINEKDFLYSERNIDLNGDGDTDDSYPVEYRSDSIIINGIKSIPLFRKKNGDYILIPFDGSNRENSIKVIPGGHNISIHTYEPLIGKIKTMIAESSGETIFREFPNSLIIVELIHNNGEEPDNLTINNSKPDRSFTNEKVFSPGGDNLKRYITGINLNLQNNSSSGSININNIHGNFKIRLFYLFSISSRAVIQKEKFLSPVTK